MSCACTHTFFNKLNVMTLIIHIILSINSQSGGLINVSELSVAVELVGDCNVCQLTQIQYG